MKMTIDVGRLSGLVTGALVLMFLTAANSPLAAQDNEDTMIDNGGECHGCHYCGSGPHSEPAHDPGTSSWTAKFGHSYCAYYGDNADICGNHASCSGFDVAQLAIAIETIKAMRVDDLPRVLHGTMRIELNRSRRAVQIYGGCNSAVLVHLPLTAQQYAALAPSFDGLRGVALASRGWLNASFFRARVSLGLLKDGAGRRAVAVREKATLTVASLR